MRYQVYLVAPICLFAGLLFMGVPVALAQTTACEKVGRIEPICGLSRPEDMVLLPNSNMMVISQMGEFLEGGPGTLAVMHTKNKQHRVIYPPATDISQPPPKYGAGWGDASCTGELGAQLSPHGIDVSVYQGKIRLLVVNHGGGRESVEFFEISGVSSSSDIEDIKIQWTGCVHAPQDALLNDVAATFVGGFVVSKMMDISGSWWINMFKAFLSLDTGYVWEWFPNKASRIVPGTMGSFPNGVAVSLDGRHLFVNMYMSDEIVKIRMSDGMLLGKASVRQADNMTWDAHGKLLVASHQGGMIEQMSCGGNEQPCQFAFEIVRVDPRTMLTQTILAHRGMPMGAATTALDVGDWLYMGSYAGDRMIRIPYNVGRNANVP